MYYICVAYMEPNLVSLLAAQFLACFAQHRPGKIVIIVIVMHYNIITRSASLTIFYNLYSWMAHEILIELFSPGDVLSRFCFFFRVSFQNFFKESAQVEAKSQWLQLEDFSPEWFFGCLLKSFQKKKCSFWWQKVDFARQSFLPFKLLISPIKLKSCNLLGSFAFPPSFAKHSFGLLGDWFQNT